MFKSFIFIVYCFLLNIAWVNAEVFKWVDEQGNIHYSYKKPTEQDSEKIKINAHSPDLTQLSNTSSNNPIAAKATKTAYKKKQKIIMYSASWCGYCKKARAYFNKNNILFSEYDIEKNITAKKRYQRLGGTGVPLLVANKRQQMQGFNVAQFKRWYETL